MLLFMSATFSDRAFLYRQMTQSLDLRQLDRGDFCDKDFPFFLN